MNTENKEETTTLSMKIYIKDRERIRFISSILNVSSSKFIRMCIQEWLVNHSALIDVVDNNQDT